MMADIRPYTPAGRQACLAVFRSNLPKFFAPEELALFIDWLDKPELADYYVLEAEGRLIGCGGFYALPALRQASLAWGMIHSDYHGQGYGSLLTAYRLALMRERFPGYALCLSTSQHTFGFYEKQGYEVREIIADGFGKGLDKYIMERS